MKTEPTMADIDEIFREYVAEHLSKPPSELTMEEREHARVFFQRYHEVKEAHLQTRIVPMTTEQTPPNILERLDALAQKIEAYLTDLNNDELPVELTPHRTCEIGQDMHLLGFDFVQAGLGLAQDIANSQERKEDESVH